jgi:2-C-methyl-D-erythritol 2,4-cyclodiphosphate synthase
VVFRIGIGIDTHKLEKGESLILGGIKIPHTKGTIAHSDGDVLIHAIIDAILGAVNLGDIGKLFPDNNQKYKDIDSTILLKKTIKLITKKNYKIENIDSTIILQKPKLINYIENIKYNLSAIMNIDISNISVKATTTEYLGFEGKEEGITVHAIILLSKL